MKKVTISLYFNTGFAGAEHTDEDTLEFDDDATDDEIAKECQSYALEWWQELSSDWGYEITNTETVKDGDP